MAPSRPGRALRRLLLLAGLGLGLLYLSFFILDVDDQRRQQQLQQHHQWHQGHGEKEAGGAASSGAAASANDPKSQASNKIPWHRVAAAKLMNFPLIQAMTSPRDAAEESAWLAGRRDLASAASRLGSWLLSPEETPPPAKVTNRSAPYLIHVWMHGPFLERRHLRRFSRDKKYSPWENCSVNNCRLSYSSDDLHSADAVLFHMHRTSSATSLPKRRNYAQRWIFLIDESPANTFSLRRTEQSIADYDGLFNWSMTYRWSSDVPVPYGRTVLRPAHRWVIREKDGGEEGDAMSTALLMLARKLGGKELAAVLGSNCSGRNDRWKYILELKKILGDRLQILGRCHDANRTVCPGHFESDCPTLRRFKFYLSFENTNCREYVSEKVFWNAYRKYAVPVIMGAPRTDCQRLLPPKSYLHVADFANPRSLADYLLYLDRVDEDYVKLHAWRRAYRVVNEHGYFGSASKHYCRVCEALNYNSPEVKVYRDMGEFWNEARDCHAEE